MFTVNRIHFSIFAVLLSLGGIGMAFPAHAVDSQCRLLHEAAFLDEPTEVEDLLDDGVHVNCLDQFYHTPLITAANGASIDSFRILIRAGAKTDVRDEWGLSPLERVLDKMEEYDMEGGQVYQSIFRQMADMLRPADPGVAQ